MLVPRLEYWQGTSPRPLVVFSSGVGWDSIKGSDRHLAECLTRHADVLWADAPVSYVTRDRFRGAGDQPPRRSLVPQLGPSSDGVVRLRPVGPPGWSRRGVRSLTWPLIRAQIHWALRRLGRTPDVFVACHPHDVLDRWGDRVVNVLYGTDDWVAGAGLMNQDPRRVLGEERAAIGRADVVLAVGLKLADRWRALGAKPVVFPNGCDTRAYGDLSASQRGSLPAGFPTPVAGVIGQLSARIDAGLLAAVADSGAGLLLVGPPEPRWWHEQGKALLARRNVHHVGPVPFEEVPRWLASIDVGLVPYADSEFNRASFPLKTLEYLAGGLPVVSTDLPASRQLRAQTDQLWIAADRKAFVDAVWEAARVPDTAEVVRQRQAVAEGYTWVTRAEEFARLVGIPL